MCKKYWVSLVPAASFADLINEQLISLVAFLLLNLETIVGMLFGDRFPMFYYLVGNLFQLWRVYSQCP